MPDIAASLTDVVLTKRCYMCCEKLPVIAFHRHAKNADGLDGKCKECKKKYQQANPVMRQTDGMVSSARRRAKRKRLEFNIDHEYVRSLVTKHCPILGIPLEWSSCRGNGHRSMEGSPSLDRIDPVKGYVRGNVWIISHRANRIKNDATHEELKLVAKAVGKALVESLEF
jgi:hypothetical protein